MGSRREVAMVSAVVAAVAWMRGLAQWRHRGREKG